ncbi:MAG: hypothetical protein PQJ60_10880 [Spirochaetales bacterium]|nr:hypothetical protein [Spirochaetales bacterium]
MGKVIFGVMLIMLGFTIVACDPLYEVSHEEVPYVEDGIWVCPEDIPCEEEPRADHLVSNPPVEVWGGPEEPFSPGGGIGNDKIR